MNKIGNEIFFKNKNYVNSKYLFFKFSVNFLFLNQNQACWINARSREVANHQKGVEMQRKLCIVENLPIKLLKYFLKIK